MMMARHRASRRFSVGAKIICCVPGQEGAPREIVAIDSRGVSWKYVGFGDILPSGEANEFYSGDSNDPFFEAGWVEI